MSDLCLPDALQPADVPKIIAIGAETEPKIARIFERLIEERGGEAGATATGV